MKNILAVFVILTTSLTASAWWGEEESVTFTKAQWRTLWISLGTCMTPSQKYMYNVIEVSMNGAKNEDVQQYLKKFDEGCAVLKEAREASKK